MFMPATPEDLFALFDRLGIQVATHHHEAAFTVEQGNAVWGDIPGVHCKNLFLKDAKAKLWLVVAPADRRIDLKALPARIRGARRLDDGTTAAELSPLAQHHDHHHPGRGFPRLSGLHPAPAGGGGTLTTIELWLT